MEKDVVHPITTSGMKASIVQILFYLLKGIRLVDRKRFNKSVTEQAWRCYTPEGYHGFHPGLPIEHNCQLV